MNIYLVVAHAGSYSNEDVDSWVVCAYPDLALAEQHASKAQQRWQRLRLLSRLWTESRERPTTWLTQFGDPREGTNCYDPSMRYNDDTRYEVECMPMLSQVGRMRLSEDQS